MRNVCVGPNTILTLILGPEDSGPPYNLLTSCVPSQPSQEALRTGRGEKPHLRSQVSAAPGSAASPGRPPGELEQQAACVCSADTGGEGLGRSRAQSTWDLLLGLKRPHWA